jgi:hypothetical protein
MGIFESFSVGLKLGFVRFWNSALELLASEDD